MGFKSNPGCWGRAHLNKGLVCLINAAFSSAQDGALGTKAPHPVLLAAFWGLRHPSGVLVRGGTSLVCTRGALSTGDTRWVIKPFCPCCHCLPCRCCGILHPEMLFGVESVSQACFFYGIAHLRSPCWGFWGLGGEWCLLGVP